MTDMRAKSFVFISLFLFSALTAAAQNRFEGYSLVVEADNGGTCPLHWLPGAGEGNSIQVFVAGTNQQTPATALTACNGSAVRSGNGVFANGDGAWCFSGAEPMYEIRLRNGVSYLWYPITRSTGFYNVKDFRPVTRTTGLNPQYIFNDPPDYTKTITNAVAFIAARQGGTLLFPDGDYIVGTTDGNTRDPNYQAITLPSGITIEGASPKFSIPTTNAPMRTGATRIRLRNENQSIFRIGGCTYQVAVRQIELLGNSALYGEPRRSSTGDIGIEGMGKWTLRPQETTNDSQGFTIENVTFQNLDKGIFVHNANDPNCNPREQACNQWQFDYVKVDHGLFLNNKTGIWVDTFNTDWKITNSFFSYTAANAPGDAIHLQHAGAVLLEQVHGGGGNYTDQIGGTFLYIDTVTSLTVINSASERSRRSIYMNPLGATTGLMINVIGSIFGDRVELGGRINYISSGNFYGARTIQADAATNITSVGDRFCYDPIVLPGQCKDASGRTVNDPGITGGNVMFQTGHLPEGNGADRINARPNRFGYDVAITNGLMQYDPNVTFNDISAWAGGDTGNQRVSDGALVYCKDCRKDSGGICTQGQAGSDGAFAKRINGRWRCD